MENNNINNVETELLCDILNGCISENEGKIVFYRKVLGRRGYEYVKNELVRSQCKVILCHKLIKILTR